MGVLRARAGGGVRCAVARPARPGGARAAPLIHLRRKSAAARREASARRGAPKPGNHLSKKIFAERALSKDRRRVERDDGGFDAVLRRSAVQDEDVREIFSDVSRRRGARAAREVRARRGDRHPRRRDEVARNALRHPHGDGVEAGGDERGDEDFLERMSVRGPGQKRRMSASAAAGTLFTTLRSIFRSLTWTMTGLSAGRPFAAKIFATAFASSAFAPRP